MSIAIAVEGRKAVVVEVVDVSPELSRLESPRFFICLEEGWRELDTSVPSVRSVVGDLEWRHLHNQALQDALGLEE